MHIKFLKILSVFLLILVVDVHHIHAGHGGPHTPKEAAEQIGDPLGIAGDPTLPTGSPSTPSADPPKDPAAKTDSEVSGDADGSETVSKEFQLDYSPDHVNLGPSGFDINPTGWTGVADFGENVIRFFTGVVVLIAILVFMIGAGFLVFSAGNDSLVGQGKDMMLYSVIGLLLVLGAYVLVKLVQVILYALGT